MNRRGFFRFLVACTGLAVLAPSKFMEAAAQTGVVPDEWPAYHCNCPFPCPNHINPEVEFYA